MLAHRRGRQARRLGELAGTPGPVAQELHDAEAGGVGERLEHRCQPEGTICFHVDNSYYNSNYCQVLIDGKIGDARIERPRRLRPRHRPRRRAARSTTAGSA